MRVNHTSWMRSLAVIVWAWSTISSGAPSNGAEAKSSTKDDQTKQQVQLIVPGERVGQLRLGAKRAEVVEKLGKPEAATYGTQRFPMDNLPKEYYLHFKDLSFLIKDDRVTQITVSKPCWRLANGVGVGASEEQVKKTLGAGFQLRKNSGKDFLIYPTMGLNFEIDKRTRTVTEINVEPITAAATGSDL
jgi:hypothetical protein